MARFAPLELQPGVVKVDSPYSMRGRWVDAKNVRFNRTKPEKIMGWERLGDDTLEGICRSLLVWDDNDLTRHYAFGTHSYLYHGDTNGDLADITPISETGSLNGPFDTTDGSAVVVVNDTSHGLSVSQRVIFADASAGGGITISGEYEVNTVTGANTYTIIHSSAATSTATGTGGASVTFTYLIAAGNQDVTQGGGWGIGTWSRGEWSSESDAAFTQYPRNWSLDNYGENLLAMPSGGFLYEWDPDSPSTRAAKITNSPTGQFMFVTNERFPVVCGADGDLMSIAWPDQNDITDWTPADDNTANVRRLTLGSRIVGGTVLIGLISLLWTDKACYKMQYTGSSSVYSTLPAGKDCGLIGPQAMVVANSIAYWMSNFNFFMYTGVVKAIPRTEEMLDWLLPRLDELQNWKAHSHFDARHNDITWFYVLDGELEPTYYVMVSLDDYSWSMGEYDRTAWGSTVGVNAQLLAVSSLGRIYEHNIGWDADGSALEAYITSAPIDIDDGNTLVDIQGYVPDFESQAGAVTLELTSYDYPMSATALDDQDITIAVGDTIKDFYFSGRQVAMTLRSNVVGGKFRLGKPRVLVNGGGKR